MSRSNQTRNFFPVLGRLSRMFDRVLTSRGKVAVAATIFFLIGSIHVDSPIYYLCGASLSVLFVSFVGSRFFRPSLEYSLTVPSIVTAGLPFRPRLNIRNAGQNGYDLKFRWLASRSALRRFQIDDQVPVQVDELNSGEQVSISLPLRAVKRGIYKLPAIQASSSFPFDLFLLSDIHSNNQKLVVAPAFTPLTSGNFLTGFLAYKLLETHRQTSLGEQEFVGTREYVPGLPGRRWDYRAWARTGKPHLRQHEGYSHQQVNIVIDTIQNEPNPEAFESLVSLSMAIVDHLLKQTSQRLGEFAIGNRLLQLPRDDRERQFVEICRQLAVAKPKTNLVTTSFHGIVYPGQSLIFLSSEFGSSQQTFLERQHATGAGVVAIIVSDSIENPVPAALRSTVKVVSTNDANLGAVEI